MYLFTTWWSSYNNHCIGSFSPLARFHRPCRSLLISGLLHLLFPHQEPSSPIYPEAPPLPPSFPSTLQYHLLNHLLLNTTRPLFFSIAHTPMQWHTVFLLICFTVSPLQAPRMTASWNFWLCKSLLLPQPLEERTLTELLNEWMDSGLWNPPKVNTLRLLNWKMHLFYRASFRKAWGVTNIVYSKRKKIL